MRYEITDAQELVLLEQINNSAMDEHKGRICGTDVGMGCGGSGIYYGHGQIVNGVFKGHTGTCFRCGGKGWQTEADEKRNNYYDNHVKKFY